MTLSLGWLCNGAVQVCAASIDSDVYGSNYAYDALGERSNAADRKELYNDISEAAEYFWNSEDNLTDTTALGEYVYALIDLSGYNLTRDDIIETYWAFKNDNPVYYYVSNTCTIAEDGLILSTDAEYKDGSTRQSYNDLIKSQIENYASSVQACETDYDKVVAIHDMINQATEYRYGSDNKPVQDAYAHDITGVLIKGAGVCESYARTFQVIMNYLNIDNMIVTGTSLGELHAWNTVQLDDGKYYYIDCTWDDTTSSNNYLLKGSYSFDIDHSKYTPDNTGTAYLYALPEISVDDYLKSFTLKKGNTVIGRFSNVNMAFDKMTDTAGKYVFDIDEDKALYMPTGKWPAVKEISFEGGTEFGNYYPVYLLGDCTAQSDIVIKGIRLNTVRSYLESQLKNAVLNIGSHSFNIASYACLGGEIVFVQGVNGSGVNIKGNAGSTLDVNEMCEIITEYINVDKIQIGNAELSSKGAHITANEIAYNGESTVRLYGDVERKMIFNTKKTTVAQGKRGSVYINDMAAGSVISNGAVAGSGEFQITVICIDGKRYPDISISNSKIPVSISVLNSEVYIMEGPDGEEKSYAIWDGLKEYKGAIANIGTTSLDKIQHIAFQLGTINSNNEFVEECSNNLSSLFAKDSKGNLYRKYDENYQITNGIMTEYQYYTKIVTTNFVIPSGVKRIGSYALMACDTAKSITIPNTVNRLDDFAICGSRNLKEIVVPPSVTKIGDYAFGYYLVDGDMHKIKNLTVICVKNSAAYKYVIEHGLSYKLIPEKVKKAQTVSNTHNAVTLKWSKVDKATGYIVKQYKNGKWTTVKKTRAGSAKITGLPASTTYKFRIFAYIKDGSTYRYSYKAASLTTATTPKPVAKLKATRNDNFSVKISWAKNTTASGYIIEMKKAGKWSKAATVKKNKTTSYIVKKLAKDNEYSFRIRSYKKIGGKTYYSAYRSVKIWA